MGYLEDKYGGGKTNIYYFKDPECLMGHMGIIELPEKCKIDINDIEKTHRLLGSVPSTDLDEIYWMMQGENWSPEGEARGFIAHRRLSHTSMVVGDMIQLPDGEFWMVAIDGFKKISDEVV